RYRVGRFLALFPAIDRVRQQLRRLEPLPIECHQLAHASEVVVADEKDDLVRRVRREPGEKREALTPGALAVVRLAPVEVITHRHELDVRPQAPTVAKQ